MLNVTNAYFVENFRMKFRFEGEGGNNIYLDDINLYQGAQSDNIVLGINEITELNSFGLYPNPADEELNVQFNLAQAEKVNFEITNLAGQKIDRQVINASQGDNLILFDTAKLASGMYLLTVGTGNSAKTVQFVVK
jgi:hypothetical protein